MTAPVRTLILAGSFSEAAKYAKGMQLKHYRYAVSAHSVTSFRPDDIVELPGYESRRDKHAFGTIIRNAARRGVEVRKDEYIPPPPPSAPQYGEEGYVADLTFGDLVDIEAFGKLIDGVADALAQKQDDFVESNPANPEDPTHPAHEPHWTDSKVQDERVNDAKPAEPVQNKVSGRGKKSAPKATKTGGSIQSYKPKPGEQLIKPAAPKNVTSAVDDLFED